MIHARSDYNRFQDPALADSSLLGGGGTPFAEDEPVFLLRAKDALFIPTLEAYNDLLMDHPDREMASRMQEAINGHISLAEDWQTTHSTKAPDMPEQKS